MLHVDLATADELKELVEERADACVSIYLPTHAVTQHTDVDRLEQLRSHGLDKARKASLEEQLRDLGDAYEFWRFQSSSLAVLATPDRLRTFRLPSCLQPAAEVSDRFHLKPMIRAVSFPNVAFVLALSENAARLIEVTPDGPAEEVEVPDMPASLAQVISTTSGRTPISPPRTGGEGQKILMRKYAREVDRALRPILSGRDIPLILACVEELAPIYRSVNSSPHLTEEVIGGNVEHLSARELAEGAREVLRRHNAQWVAALRERFESWRGHGRASSDVAQIGRAVSAGAVHMLMFDIDGAVYGPVDEQTGVLHLEYEASASIYDIIDKLMGRTIQYGGRAIGVRSGDLPDPNSPAAALLRYPA
jgi:hypothetical protein